MEEQTTMFNSRNEAIQYYAGFALQGLLSSNSDFGRPHNSVSTVKLANLHATNLVNELGLFADEGPEEELSETSEEE